MAWDRETTQKLWLALGISVAVHLSVALVGEISSHGRVVKETPPPPVEISRVAMDGTMLPVGSGTSSFNSPKSQASPGEPQETYHSLEAGVPMRLPEPPKQSQNPTPQPYRSPVPYVPPVSGRQSQPASQPQFQPPPVQSQPTTNQPETQTPPVSSPPLGAIQSQPASAGNGGKPRSRGPNRAAFPVLTIEPNVPQAMVSGGVTNSVQVTVDIAADGSHTERIVRTSGSEEVDALVLEAMKQWKWDPAARDNNAIDSTQSFKFTFKPRG